MIASGDRAFVKTFPYKVRCDYCHRPVTQVRMIQIGDYEYKLHDLREIVVAQKNYEENVANGVTPTKDRILEDNDTIVESNDDNIEQE